MENQKPITVKGVLYWANLHQKNQMSDKYQVDICQLSDAAVAALEGVGVNVKSAVKDGDERGRFITCKSAKPIFASFDNGEVIPAETLVGNNSIAVATLSFYEWTFKSNKGVSPSIRRLVVTDLVEYDAEPLDSMALEAAL